MNDERRRWAVMTEKAAEFGKLRGWKLTKDHFGWKKLAGQRQSWTERMDRPPYCDHTWYYKVGRQPVGLVTFPYRVDTDECEVFAEKHGLVCEFNPDYPNWYGFGTFMVVWTRRIS